MSTASASKTRTLTDRTFARRTVEEGGATRHAATLQEPNGSGYAVGGKQTRKGRRFPERKIPLRDFFAGDVSRHLRDIREVFGINDPTLHQGSWVEGANVILDASDVIPDRDEAIKQAKKRGERAIYDLGSGQDIRTDDGK